MNILFIPIVFCTIATLLGVIALRRVLVRPSNRYTINEAVTVLKPLCGADDALTENLETFFTQSHPNYELIFGVVGSEDPAIRVVESLRERYPEVKCRLVIHDGHRGLNPKVANLEAMMDWALYDTIVMSDSNVSVPTDYLSEMIAPLADPRVGLVTSLIRGVAETDLGSRLDHLHLNGFAALNIAISHQYTEQTGTIGKSLAFRRSVFGGLGGFSSVGALLAEDYVMGRMFTEAGYRVELAASSVDNVCERKTVGNFVARHLRWGLLRSRVMPLIYPVEPLLNPIALALIGWALGLGAWVFAWALMLTLIRDTAGWWLLRGTDGLIRTVPLGIYKDALCFGVWAIAPFMKQISWRGKRFRVSSGSRLYAFAPDEENTAGARS